MCKIEITEQLRQKYTSHQIAKLENHQPLLHNCGYCGEIFDAQSYIFRPTAIYPRINEFCSTECLKKGAGHKNKKVFREYVCEHCGNHFVPARKSKVHQKFCNIQCRSAHIKGQPRPVVQQWIHKITPPSGSISKQEVEWLSQFDLTHKQHIITINKRSYRVDGYNEYTNTIYEYLGSFWHGNPSVYNPTDINPKNKKTFGELYQSTMDRIALFEQNGYTVVYKWSAR